jgi:hypothetical protein
MIDLGIEWLKKRFSERTTWDGIIMVGVGVTYLVIEPIGTVVAYGAIAYGAWTVWKSET